MTEKQRQQFNRMRHTLTKIFKYYQTPDQLRRNGEKDYGPGYQESLEMAYENLQSEARFAVKGVKEAKPPKRKKAKAVAPILTIALILSAIFSGCHSGYQPHNSATLIFWKAGDMDDGFLQRDDELNDLVDSVHKYFILSLVSLRGDSSDRISRKYDSFYISYREAYKMKTFK